MSEPKLKGDELERLRQLLGWSVDDCAEKFNITQTVWYNYEQGRTVPPDGVAEEMLRQVEMGPPPDALPAALMPKQITPTHLKNFREHFDLSQLAAGALIGVTRHTWMRWEAGSSKVPVYMFHTLRGAALWLKEKTKEPER